MDADIAPHHVPLDREVTPHAVDSILKDLNALAEGETFSFFAKKKTLQDNWSKATATKKKHAFSIFYHDEEGNSNELSFDNEGGLLSADMWLLGWYHPVPTQCKPNGSLSGNE